WSASLMRTPISSRRWSNWSSLLSMLFPFFTQVPPVIIQLWYQSPYILPYRGKDPGKGFAARLLEIERMNLFVAVRSFKLSIAGKCAVATEFFRSFDRDFRKTGEDVVLEYLKDGVIRNFRRAEGLLAFLPDILLAVGNGDEITL